jgi:hypothetical protein
MPVAAIPAPEPATLEEPTPQEPQQAEARAGGEEQVEAPDAAPADGIGNHLTVQG